MQPPTSPWPRARADRTASEPRPVRLPRRVTLLWRDLGVCAPPSNMFVVRRHPSNARRHSSLTTPVGPVGPWLLGVADLLRGYDDVLDRRHVVRGRLGGLLDGASGLPGIDVGGVPVPPVVGWSGLLVGVMVLRRLVQQVGQTGDIHVSPPTPGRGAGS